MEWKLDDSRPIWPQLKEKLKKDIVAGKYPTGGQFPTVRELAEDAKVNRNTMQRALSELEGDGLLVTNRTAGRMVTTDEALIRECKDEIAKGNLQRFFEEMQALGYDELDTFELMKQEIGGKDK